MSLPVDERIHLFIDTNVLLSFYHFSQDDLEELLKLIVLLRERELVLLMPEQVVDEFWRNRDVKIADALRTLEGNRFDASLPPFSKAYEEYNSLRAHLREAASEHDALVRRLRSDASLKALKADAVVEELIELAVLLTRTPELILKAQERNALGNPPGKRGSIGDALNWLALLESDVRGDDEVRVESLDLHLISDDGDYASSLDPDAIQPFLAEEWSKARDGKVFYYRRLSDYFSKHHPDIKLASDLEKEVLVANLAQSPNFETTHSIIARLRSAGDLSNAQANGVVGAALSNNQVRWILGDRDLQRYFTELLDKHEGELDAHACEQLTAELKEARERKST